MEPKAKAVILAGAIILLSAVAAQKARAAEVTLFVNRADPACSETASPPCYTTIQRAIDFADSILTSQTLTTDTYKVLVEPGTYPEQITLRPKIDVSGRETARTVLTGGGVGTVVTINNMITTIKFKNFTITAAPEGISASNNTASVNITGNVFTGISGVAVRISASPLADIRNNTFYQNGTAIVRDADSVQIINNIFASNPIQISHTQTLAQTNIQNNFFLNPVPLEGEPRGAPFFPDINVQATDPLFVNPDSPPPQLDLHLKTDSPCKDRGVGGVDSVDATTNDIGAYGGPEADVIPFPVANVTAAAANDTAISVSWAANLDYQVDGYRVWYGRTSGVYDGEEAIEGDSPIDVPGSGVTSQLLSDLSFAVTTTLTAPTLNPPQPVNEGFILSWTAVPGATGYKIHYGAASTDENTVEAGNRTSFTLTGLKNGPENVYKISVSAVAQSAFYIAVTAYYIDGGITLAQLDKGRFQESILSPEVSVGAGELTQSDRSNEVSDFPEALAPYPDLPNSPQGCFIATAAFGHYSASQVRALRDFRDGYLLTNGPGSAFVKWYYARGPAAAAWLNDHPGYKPLVRTALMPAVGAAYLLTRTPFTLMIVIFMLALCMVGFALYRTQLLRRKGSR